MVCVTARPLPSLLDDTDEEEDVVALVRSPAVLNPVAALVARTNSILSPNNGSRVFCVDRCDITSRSLRGRAMF